MADVLRVSIQGQMPGGEVWSINPVFSVEPPGRTFTFDEVQAMATAAGAVTVPSDLRLLNVAGVTVNTVRVEARTFGGALETLAEAAVTGSTFGQGAAKLPYQSSTVFSLRTTLPGGRGRGRLYWPATAVTLAETTLRISTPTTSAIANAAKTYLSGIRTAIRTEEPLSNLVVWSRINGATTNVSSLLVGDIVDTQRRRRDALSEAFTTVAFPTS